MENMLESLGRCPIFRSLDRDEIQRLFQTVAYARRTFEKNEPIYRAGDPAYHIGVILSGRIEIRKYLSSGNQLSVFQRTGGEVLGGSIVFSSDPRYPCEVVAKEKSELLFIEKDKILDMALKHATIALNILRISADRIMQFEKRLELSSYYSIQKKIAFSLLHDFELDTAQTATLPFSKTTWSEYLNVSRTSLSRELKSLCDQGIIRMEGNTFTVLNRGLLEALLW